MELLIDGDVLVYTHAHSAQEVTRWSRDLYTTHAYLGPAIQALDSGIELLKERLDGDIVTVVLSDNETNFRQDLCPEYKTNRSGVIRPILWSPLREYFLEQYGAIVFPNVEGDDALGILATDGRSEDRIIVSIDKDLRTVPCTLYDPKLDEVVIVTEAEARRHHLIQTMAGDRTDGYPGIPGIGHKRAAAALDKHGDLATAWEAVVLPAYRKAGLNEDVALMYARCAYILQDGDYDRDTGNIDLWTPGRLKQ